MTDRGPGVCVSAGRRHHEDDDDEDREKHKYRRHAKHVEDADEDSDHDHDDRGNHEKEESILVPAAATSVIWRGPESYKGYSASRQQQPQTKPSRPPVQTPQTRPYYQPPIYNRDRQNDRKYREGLNELAGMM